MRQILFHGKRVDTGEWVEGFYDEYYIRPGNRLASHIHVLDCPAVFEVDPDTVGEYTGLTDKNGGKIFEGDILRQKTTPKFATVNSSEWERLYIVRFGYCDFKYGWAGHDTYGFYLSFIHDDADVIRRGIGSIKSDNYYGYYPFEVVGNIYDNSKLLEVEK